MMNSDSVMLLARCSQAAPSADNSQPCSLDWQSPVLTLRYDAERVNGSTFPYSSQASLLSAGAALENILSCCELFGIATEVVIFPEGEASEVYARVTIKDIDAEPCSDMPPLILGRHTNRFSYKKAALPQLIVDRVAALSGSGGARVKTLTDKSSIAQIAEQIKAASEIRFQTQEVHEWLEKSLRFSAPEVERGDGLDIKTLALPPGGGLFLRFISSWSRMGKFNRIGGYKLLAAIDAAPVKVAPAIVALTAPASLYGALEAGRIMCRVWAYLNAQGVACHPYYVIPDQLERLALNKVPGDLVKQAEGVRESTRQLLDLNENETVMMLLRVGYPVKEAVRSRRLPLAYVYRDLSKN